MRDLGRLGESFFFKLCSEVGLKANKSSDNDSTGWDYVVEFPESQTTELTAFERDFSKILCKIQIKATDKLLGKQNIKLSNLKRFVHEVNPAFIVVFEFDGQNNPQSCYLIHVGEEIIGQTIKALRLADLKKSQDIHKKSVAVKYDKSHQFEPVGIKLKEVLLKHIGTDTLQYTKRKMDLIKNVGYEGPNFKISFDTNDEAYENLVECMLGLKESTDINNLIISDVRFGLQKELGRYKESQVKIGPAVNREKIQMFCLDNFGNEHARINADIYTPGILIPRLPKHLHKIRFKSTYIDIIINLGTNATNVKLKLPQLGQPLELFECHEQLNFFFKCIETKCIGIERSDGSTHDFHFNVNEYEDFELKRIFKLLSFACEILKKNDIRSCKCPLIFLEQQSAQIHAFMNTIKPLNELLITSELIGKNTLRTPYRLAMVCNFIINLNEWKIATSIGFAGETNISKNGNKEIVHIEHPVAISQRTIKRKNKIEKSDLKRIEKEVSNELQNDDYDMILMK